MITTVLGTGRAGMIWQDAEQASDWKAFGDIVIGRPVIAADDAVLLIGGSDCVSFDDIALHVTHRTVTVIVGLLCRATVPAHRHPAGVDDDPSLLRLVTDHRGEHRQRYILRRAHADIGH